MTVLTTLMYDIRERIRIHKMIILSMGITNGPIVAFLAIANVHRKLTFYVQLAKKIKNLYVIVIPIA